MSKSHKQAKRSLKEGSRQFRRVTSNQHVIKKVLKGMSKYLAMKAADRQNYVRQFFAMWENAVAAVDHAAETILSFQSVSMSNDTWKALVEPYGTWPIFYFARLMDHLTADEEARFSATCNQFNCAWQKFFAATLVRHPELRELTERMAENRRAAHDEVVDLFTGESLPALTPRWARAYNAFLNDYGQLAKGLQK